jgi:thymidine kinase
MQCGAPANRTQRLTSATDRVVVGGSEEYEARCRRCFQPQIPVVAAEQPQIPTVAAEQPGTGRSET